VLPTLGTTLRLKKNALKSPLYENTAQTQQNLLRWITGKAPDSNSVRSSCG